MKDDDLIRGVANALREEEADHEKWEALAKGEMSPEERAELEKLAQTDEHTAQALEAYAPLGNAFEEAMAQSFLKSDAASNAHAQHAHARPASPKTGMAKVFRLTSFIAAPLAIAAAALLWMHRAPSESTLPSYEIALASNLKEARAGEPEMTSPNARLHKKAYFEAVARPSMPLHEPIEARAVLLRDGHATPWEVPIAISDEGAVRIAGPADSLFPQTSGAYDIVVALAPANALPTSEDLARAAERGGMPPTYRVVRAHVEFAGE